MDKNEVVLTVTKELLVTMLATKSITLNLQGGDAAVDDLGEKFKRLSLKINEALESIKS